MNRTLLLILWLVVCETPGLWLVAGSVLKVMRDAAPRSAVAVYHELRPFYWPLAWLACLVFPISGGFGLSPAALLLLGLYWAGWRLLRDVGGDDDRWKRRRKRLAEKVARVGSRLAVVPAGAET